MGALWLHFVTPLALFWDSSLSVATSVGVVYGWTVRDGRIHVSGLGCIVAPFCDAFGTILGVQMPSKIVF